MPQFIPLQALPNQAFSIQLDGNFYDFTVKSVAGAMGVTISRNNTILVSNSRMVSGTLLLTYGYLENNSGNFFLRAINGDIANYQEFGITQSLIYLSNAERLFQLLTH